MDKLIINGPNKIEGAVAVSSAKNASLPILAATLLSPAKITFKNLPGLSDISFFTQILNSLGVQSSTEGSDAIFMADDINNVKADYDLVRKMRASVLVLGPLLARKKEAIVSLPGGCAIGSRPVDIHLKGMEQLGAQIEIKKGYIYAKTKGLIGNKIVLPFPSVGATENIMMAAVMAQGETTIDNAAREPEIEDLGDFLNTLGFKVTGHGSSTIKIEGTAFEELPTKAIDYSIIGDRIEAATYIIAALMMDSELKVTHFKPAHLDFVLNTLDSMGAKMERGEDYVHVFPSGQLKGTRIETAPYPGFPTDVQAQIMALMGVCDGDSVISENIFENRFMHVPELVRMGYDVEIDGNNAFVKGNSELTGAPVMCTDLRASAALILAAMCAKGESSISRIYHLDRGYEKLALKFAGIKGNVQRVKE